MTISTACSSSAKVFAAAARHDRTAVLIDAALVGGVDSLCLTTLYGFDSLELTSPRPCRPYDAHRDGISIGEGAAFALLERGPRTRADAGAAARLRRIERRLPHVLAASGRLGRAAGDGSRAEPAGLAAGGHRLHQPARHRARPATTPPKARRWPRCSATAAVQFHQGRDRPYAGRRRRRRGGDLRAGAVARLHARQRQHRARSIRRSRSTTCWPPRTGAAARAEQFLWLRRQQLQPGLRSGRDERGAAVGLDRRHRPVSAPGLPDWPAARGRPARRAGLRRAPTVLPAPAAAAPGRAAPRQPRHQARARASGSRPWRRRPARMPPRWPRCSPPPAATATTARTLRALASRRPRRSRRRASTIRCITRRPATGASPRGAMAPSQVVCALRRQLRRRPAGSAGAGRGRGACRSCWSPTTASIPEPLHEQAPDARCRRHRAAARAAAGRAMRWRGSARRLSRDPALRSLADPSLERLRRAIPALRGLAAAASTRARRAGPRPRWITCAPLQPTVEVSRALDPRLDLRAHLRTTDACVCSMR